MLNYFLATPWNRFHGINGPRFQELDGSAARYICELAKVLPRSAELQGTFDRHFLDNIQDQLRALTIALRKSKEGRNSDDCMKQVKLAFGIAFGVSIAHASVICCTASVATAPGFQVIRRTHAVTLEDVRHVTETEFMGFLGKYWDETAMFVGDLKELGPLIFAPERGNPFAAQYKCSALYSLKSVGSPVNVLEQTTRFKNQLMLDLARNINDAHTPRSFARSLALSISSCEPKKAKTKHPASRALGGHSRWAEVMGSLFNCICELFRLPWMCTRIDRASQRRLFDFFSLQSLLKIK